MNLLEVDKGKILEAITESQESFKDLAAKNLDERLASLEDKSASILDLESRFEQLANKVTDLSKVEEKLDASIRGVAAEVVGQLVSQQQIEGQLQELKVEINSDKSETKRQFQLINELRVGFESEMKKELSNLGEAVTSASMDLGKYFLKHRAECVIPFPYTCQQHIYALCCFSIF